MPHGNQLSYAWKLKKIEQLAEIYSVDATGDLNDLCLSLFAIIDDRDTRPYVPLDDNFEPTEKPEPNPDAEHDPW